MQTEPREPLRAVMRGAVCASVSGAERSECAVARASRATRVSSPQLTPAAGAAGLNVAQGQGEVRPAAALETMLQGQNRRLRTTSSSR